MKRSDPNFTIDGDQEDGIIEVKGVSFIGKIKIENNIVSTSISLNGIVKLFSNKIEEQLKKELKELLE